VVLLVLLTQLVGTHAHAKRGAHCVQGLCLVLMPGHQIGPVRPGEAIGAEVPRLPVRTRRHGITTCGANGVPTSPRRKTTCQQP